MPAVDHSGHRKRLKEEFLRRGVAGMHDYHVLELVLFHAIPRGDVNPLAHRLIQQFGSIHGVFHATYDQLLAVEGVGPSAALLLQLIPAVSARYLEESASFDGQVVSYWQVRDLLMPVFFGQRDEVAALICMDGKNKLLCVRELGKGVTSAVQIAGRKVLEAALAANASRVVLAHSHPSGVAWWSQSDIDTTLRLQELLAAAEIRLVDHVLFAGDDMASMAESGLLPAWF